MTKGFNYTKDEVVRDWNHKILYTTSQPADKAFARWLKSQQRELGKRVTYLLDRDKRRDI